MAHLNVFGEFDTDNHALAALLVTDGYSLTKCTRGADGASSTWTFHGIPECDIDIYLVEVGRVETKVPLLKFIQSLKAVDHASIRAREIGGVWTCPTRYARPGK